MIFNDLYSQATKEQKLEQIRLLRNNELAATDWTQIADVVCDKTAWAKYRQELRDLPTQNSDPAKIVFPTRPV